MEEIVEQTILYEVQELVGNLEKRWKSVTYPISEKYARSAFLAKELSYGKFRIIRIETSKFVIDGN